MVSTRAQNDTKLIQFIAHEEIFVSQSSKQYLLPYFVQDDQSFRQRDFFSAQSDLSRKAVVEIGLKMELLFNWMQWK